MKRRRTPPVAPPAGRRVAPATFARVAGVSKSTISRAVRAGGALADAFSDRLLDLDHPSVETWLVDHGLGLEIFDAMAPRPAKEIAAELGDSAKLPLEQVDSMTLRELTDRFGGAERFHAWTRARKELAMARRAELQDMRLRRLLLPVETLDRIIDTLDALSQRLLRDAATTMALQLCPDEPERATTYIQETLSGHLALTKDDIVRLGRADDPSQPLREPAERKATEPSTARTRAELERLKKHMETVTGARVAELFLRPAALLAHTGEPATPDEMARRIGRVLGNHVDEAIRNLRKKAA